MITGTIMNLAMYYLQLCLSKGYIDYSLKNAQYTNMEELL